MMQNIPRKSERTVALCSDNPKLFERHIFFHFPSKMDTILNKKVQTINGRVITDYDVIYRNVPIYCRITETNIFSNNKKSVYIVDYPVKVTDSIENAQIINYCENVGYGLPTFRNINKAKKWIDDELHDN
mgnify:CR=1 FL=1